MNLCEKKKKKKMHFQLLPRPVYQLYALLDKSSKLSAGRECEASVGKDSASCMSRSRGIRFPGDAE